MVKLEKILKLHVKKWFINLLLKIKTSSSSSSIELFLAQVIWRSLTFKMTFKLENNYRFLKHKHSAFHWYISCQDIKKIDFMTFFDVHLCHKSVAHLYLCHMCHKCGTSVAHKRGLTRFLDDLGIMHLMYVNLKYICQNMDNVLIVAGTPRKIKLIIWLFYNVLKLSNTIY